jgi:hypothetical protein
MRGELEQLLLYIYKDMDRVTRKDLQKAIEERIFYGSIYHKLHGGEVGTLKKMRDSLINFTNLFNEVVLDLSKVLKASGKEQKQYRSHELAKILNVSNAAVTIWIKKGEFPNYTKEGRKVFITENDIEVFVEKEGKYKILWEMK